MNVGSRTGQCFETQHRPPPDFMIGGIAGFAVEERGPEHCLGITFRVGKADEHPDIRGITHLVEHLTLSQWGLRDVAFNGRVDLLTTSFMVVGSEWHVAQFWRSIVEALARCDFARIPVEQHVLRAESRRAGGANALTTALGIRAAGAYECSALPERVQDRVSADQVATWLALHFTQSNASMWTSLSPELLCDSGLNAGEYLAPPRLNLRRIQFPAVSFGERDELSVHWLVPDTTEVECAFAVLRDHCFEVLRLERGLCYDVALDRERIESERLLSIGMTADATPERLEELRDVWLQTLSEVRNDGLSPRQVSKYLEERSGMRPSPDHLGSQRARSWLIGPAQAADSGTIQDVEQVLHDGALWIAPRFATWPDLRFERVGAEAPSSQALEKRKRKWVMTSSGSPKARQGKAVHSEDRSR